MKVVHLSTHDISGGAARATSRLHLALLKAGGTASLLVRSSSGNGPGMTHYRASRALSDRAVRWLARRRARRLENAIAKRRVRGVEQFNTDRAPFGAELAKALPDCDVIHLHWCAGFVDL